MGCWFFPVRQPPYVCAVSWAARLLFTGVPARFVVLRLRCPRPLGSSSPVCSLGVLCCVCGVLGHLAPVHRCACWVCCVACAVSRATGLLFTSAPARCVALRARCPGSLGSCSPVCPLGVLFCFCGSPGPLGSCSPVCPRGLLCCVWGVLGHLAPVHRCVRSLCCVACVASWAPWPPLTGVPSRCVVLRVQCPGELGSCSRVRSLGVLYCVRGVPGLFALVHRCARPWCLVPLLPSVHARVRCPGPRGACSPVCALCAVCVCHWWLCPSSSPPNFRFLFLMEKKKKRKKSATVHTTCHIAENWAVCVCDPSEENQNGGAGSYSLAPAGTGPPWSCRYL